MKIVIALFMGLASLFVTPGTAGLVLAPAAATGYIADLNLQEGASFLNIRSRLIRSGWKPIRMHGDGSEEFDGTEKRLIERKFYEVDSCSTDRGSLCILYYTRNGKCLRIDTEGEQVNDMRVTRWDESCPDKEAKRLR